jgi:hypothetical protein
MVSRFLKTLATTLVTFAFAIASLFVAVPLALVGYLALYGLAPAPSYKDSLLLGVLCLATAGLIWTATALWLAWCDGRLRRFTLRELMFAVSVAALYMGLLAALAARI